MLIMRNKQKSCAPAVNLAQQSMARLNTTSLLASSPRMTTASSTNCDMPCGVVQLFYRLMLARLHIRKH